MKLKEIININYIATINRGLISNKTKELDFITKIREELCELENSYYLEYNKKGFDYMELADIILVCLAMAKHFNIDIQKALEEKTIFNEKRKD